MPSFLAGIIGSIIILVIHLDPERLTIKRRAGRDLGPHKRYLLRLPYAVAVSCVFSSYAGRTSIIVPFDLQFDGRLSQN
jgi:hypothetical protein